MAKPMKILQLHYPIIQFLIILDIPQFCLGNIRSRDALRPITRERKDLMDYIRNCARCEKDLKDNKDNGLHLGQKYGRIFVLGYYLFLVAHIFPRALLSENCSLLGTDNVRGPYIRAYFRATWRLLFKLRNKVGED